MKNGNYYPIVYIPDTLVEIESRELKIPDLPLIPKQPIIEKKSKFWIAIIIVASFVLIASTATESIEDESASTFILLLYSVGFLTAFFESRKNNNTENNNQKNIETYNSEVKEYQEKKSFRDFLIEIQRDEILLDSHLSKKENDFFNNATKPLLKVNSKKGLTENYFKSVLMTYFPNKIFSDITIEENNSYPFKYIPDLIYMDEKMGLYIDIEIDEPYDIEDGNPIHYKDDFARINFFNSNNWIVIRFSEKQIALKSIECCKFISQIIMKYTGNEKYYNRLKSYPDISIEKMWTKEDADLMSMNNEREIYLKEIGIQVKKYNLPPKRLVIQRKVELDGDNLPF